MPRAPMGRAAAPAKRKRKRRPKRRGAASDLPDCLSSLPDDVLRLRRRSCLPKCLFSVRSLAVLSLDTCGVPRLSAVACARLRTLKLQRVFINQEIITAILSAAAGLETLEVEYCTGLSGGCTVESSSVKTFLFRPAGEQREVTLRATGLRTITLYTRPKTRKVELAPSPDVSKVYLHVSKSLNKIVFGMRPFLDAAARLSCLTLRGLAMALLADEYKDTTKLPVTFEELRTLSVSLDFSRESEVALLVKLLGSCPNLQQLNVSAAEHKKKDAGLSFAKHREMLANASCLTGSLTQFKFLGFKSEEYQKGLLIFLLNRANNLKKVAVQFPESEEAVVRWALQARKAPIERKSTLYNLCNLELEYA